MNDPTTTKSGNPIASQLNGAKAAGGGIDGVDGEGEAIARKGDGRGGDDGDAGG
jgi:hypothetical protein